LNCRAAEALFPWRAAAGRGRSNAAAAPFALAADDRGTADFCAWLFSNCGYHQEGTRSGL